MSKANNENEKHIHNYCLCDFLKYSIPLYYNKMCSYISIQSEGLNLNLQVKKYKITIFTVIQAELREHLNL